MGYIQGGKSYFVNNPLIAVYNFPKMWKSILYTALIFMVVGSYFGYKSFFFKGHYEENPETLGFLVTFIFVYQLFIAGRFGWFAWALKKDKVPHRFIISHYQNKGFYDIQQEKKLMRYCFYTVGLFTLIMLVMFLLFFPPMLVNTSFEFTLFSISVHFIMVAYLLFKLYFFDVGSLILQTYFFKPSSKFLVLLNRILNREIPNIVISLIVICYLLLFGAILIGLLVVFFFNSEFPPLMRFYPILITFLLFLLSFILWGRKLKLRFLDLKYYPSDEVEPLKETPSLGTIFTNRYARE